MRDHLTKKQAAEYFNVTMRTIENWIARGLLPAYKVGGRVVILEDDIDAAIQRIEVTK